MVWGVNMKTLIFDWKESIPQEELKQVKNILENNGLIIFPTDTVYGLGCNSFSDQAIEKIFEVKQRAKNKPINVLTDSVSKMSLLASHVGEIEKDLVERYMPGALTIIFDKKEEISNLLTSGLDTVGIRIPNNEIALKILKEVNFPLATTSANVSGEEAGISFDDVLDYFNGKVDAIIDGGVSPIQIASTIVRVENNHIHVLRQGSIIIDNNKKM